MNDERELRELNDEVERLNQKVVELEEAAKKSSMTKNEIIQRTSGNYLTEQFPTEWHTWDEDTLQEFMGANAWEPLEYLCWSDVLEQILQAADLTVSILRENGVTVKEKYEQYEEAPATSSEPNYMYKDLEDFEDSAGYKVNGAFKIAWDMARMPASALEKNNGTM